MEAGGEALLLTIDDDEPSRAELGFEPQISEVGEAMLTIDDDEAELGFEPQISEVGEAMLTIDDDEPSRAELGFESHISEVDDYEIDHAAAAPTRASPEAVPDQRDVYCRHILYTGKLIRISSKTVKTEDPARLEEFGLNEYQVKELMHKFAKLKLTVYQYDIDKVPGSDGGWHLGFMAENVKDEFPNAVETVTLSNGTKVNTIIEDVMFKIHMAATKRLIFQVQELNDRVVALEQGRGIPNGQPLAGQPRWSNQRSSSKKNIRQRRRPRNGGAHPTKSVDPESGNVPDCSNSSSSEESAVEALPSTSEYGPCLIRLRRDGGERLEDDEYGRAFPLVLDGECIRVGRKRAIDSGGTSSDIYPSSADEEGIDDNTLSSLVMTGERVV
jgi:hypothetical protein